MTTQIASTRKFSLDERVSIRYLRIRNDRRISQVVDKPHKFNSSPTLRMARAKEAKRLDQMIQDHERRSMLQALS